MFGYPNTLWISRAKNACINWKQNWNNERSIDRENLLNTFWKKLYGIYIGFERKTDKIIHVSDKPELKEILTKMKSCMFWEND